MGVYMYIGILLLVVLLFVSEAKIRLIFFGIVWGIGITLGEFLRRRVYYGDRGRDRV